MVIERVAPSDGLLSGSAMCEVVDEWADAVDSSGRRVLVIVPDNTRTAPVGPFFRALHGRIGADAAALDVLVALGTHPPLDESAMLRRMGWSPEERRTTFANVRVLNHRWDDPSALHALGTLGAEEIDMLSGGRFAMDVPVEVNRVILDYDMLVVAGPVFPHEVVGFSGGNKYFFPGISGPGLLNFFHWLGAVVTNPLIIGHKRTPVRRVIDRAAAMIPREKACFCFVVDGARLHGVYAGAPEEAWDRASDHSARAHITIKPRPFHTVLSCAPPMYDDLWVAGKCMYKLEPVVADGGELIIHAPHLDTISRTHGRTIRRIGYHCRDYFLGQWERFRDEPWGVLAHSTHVRGIGTYQDGIERPRIRVTLATGIPAEICRAVNLGHRDPGDIRTEDFAGREDDGVLLVPQAGERLFHLAEKPRWADGPAAR